MHLSKYHKHGIMPTAKAIKSCLSASSELLSGAKRIVVCLSLCLFVTIVKIFAIKHWIYHKYGINWRCKCGINFQYPHYWPSP